MQSFKTSFSHIITQGALLLCLALLTFQESSTNAIARAPVLLIVDFIVAFFFISSLIRKVIVAENKITVKTILRTSSVNLDTIEYVQSLSAFARWVIILNDGKRTVIMTSLCDGLDKIADTVTERLPEGEKHKLAAITPKSVATKKRVYNSVMIMLCLIVVYGIIKSIFGF